jgi:hypothetical protein
MKKEIVKILFSVLTIFISTITVGQSGFKFYATIDDYKNNNPISGYEIVKNSWAAILGKETFKIIQDGVQVRKNLSELPSELYTYAPLNDRNKVMLMRTFEKDSHVVLAEGAFCYYTWIGDNRGLYYSETITGKLKRFSEKAFKPYLVKYDLWESYENDKPKREPKEYIDSYFTRLVERDIKYVNLLNEKMK